MKKVISSHTGKTVKFSPEKSHHENAIPYKREKHKIDYKNYED